MEKVDLSGNLGKKKPTRKSIDEAMEWASTFATKKIGKDTFYWIGTLYHTPEVPAISEHLDKIRGLGYKIRVFPVAKYNTYKVYAKKTIG